MTRWPDDDVILYDGVCIFCSRWVRFVIARDVARRFHFTPIQSGLRHYDWRRRSASIPADPDTNAVIHGGTAYFKVRCGIDGAGRAAGLALDARRCSGSPNRCATPFTISSARNRYRIFGKYEDVLCAGCGDAGEGDGVGPALTACCPTSLMR